MNDNKRIPISEPFFPLLWKRWRGSNTVQKMNMSERGIYLELLLDQYIYGNLPADEKILSKRVGIRAVVLKKWLKKFSTEQIFSKTGHNGDKLINLTLLEILTGVSEQIEYKGFNDGEKNVAENLPSKVKETKEKESKENETIQNESYIEAAKEEVTSSSCSFKTIKMHYRSFFHTGHSPLQKYQDKYAEFCKLYGEDAVLEHFDSWAEDIKGWNRMEKNKHGLNIFFSQLPELVAAKEYAADHQRSLSKPAEEYHQYLKLAYEQTELEIAEKHKQIELDRIERQKQEEFDNLHAYDI